MDAEGTDDDDSEDDTDDDSAMTDDDDVDVSVLTMSKVMTQDMKQKLKLPLNQLQQQDASSSTFDPSPHSTFRSSAPSLSADSSSTSRTAPYSSTHSSHLSLSMPAAPASKAELAAARQASNAAASAPEAVSMPLMLLTGAGVWKVPFNGRGKPQRRWVMVKTAGVPTLTDSEAARKGIGAGGVMKKGKKSSSGGGLGKYLVSVAAAEAYAAGWRWSSGGVSDAGDGMTQQRDMDDRGRDYGPRIYLSDPLTLLWYDRDSPWADANGVVGDSFVGSLFRPSSSSTAAAAQAQTVSTGQTIPRSIAATLFSTKSTSISTDSGGARELIIDDRSTLLYGHSTPAFW